MPNWSLLLLLLSMCPVVLLNWLLPLLPLFAMLLLHLAVPLWNKISTREGPSAAVATGEGRIPVKTDPSRSVYVANTQSTRSLSTVSGGSSLSAPTPEGSVGGRVRQDDRLSGEERPCNVASEPVSSKIPSPGCASVSRQQEV